MNNNNLSAEFKNLIVSEKDKQYGLTVNTVGFQTIEPNLPYALSGSREGYFFNATKSRVLNEYQLIYITKGTGVLTIDSSNAIPISEGQIIVIFPRQQHSYYPTKESGCKEYYITFCGEIVENQLKDLCLSKENQILDLGLNEELVSLFKRAVEIAKINKKGSQLHLFGIVMHMIGLILYESQNKRLDV